MLEAQEYSAKLVFKGAKEFKSDHLFGLLTDANRAMGLTIEDTLRGRGAVAGYATNAGTVVFTIENTLRETLLILSLRAVPTEGSEDAPKATLAGYLRHVLGALDASHVEWLDTGARIPRADFLAALSPDADTTDTNQEVTAMTADNVTLLAPRRINKSKTRSKRPIAGQHAQIRAVANAALVQTRGQLQATGTDCVIAIDDQPLANLLPPVDRRRLSAANDNALRPFSAKDAKVSLQEGSIRCKLLAEVTEDELAEAEMARGPQPIEARLTTWAVSLSVATVSLPVAAPVLIYNVVRGEDLRVASLAMGLAGLFTALSGSGAMAGILPF